MTLTPTEIEQLRIAIAEEMGFKNIRYDWVNGSDAVKDYMHSNGRGIPYYTEKLDAIQAARIIHVRELFSAGIPVDSKQVTRGEREILSALLALKEIPK